MIPEEWLLYTLTFEEAWEDIGSDLTDLWLQQWWAFRGRFQPGDVLWYYGAEVIDPPDPSGDDRPPARLHEGYARVRDGVVLDTVPLPW